MEAIRDKIYVAGGVHNQARYYSDQFVCEVYDPSRDSWTLLARLPKPHVNAASGVLEEKLYVLGGFSQEDYTETVLAHRYDPRWDNWETDAEMKANIWEAFGATIGQTGAVCASFARFSMFSFLTDFFTSLLALTY
ncbi:UNVERIFIED_CONTAM: hypothetical protein FKN15_047619 [Acipenser sinensis]